MWSWRTCTPAPVGQRDDDGDPCSSLTADESAGLATHSLDRGAALIAGGIVGALEAPHKIDGTFVMTVICEMLTLDGIAGCFSLLPTIATRADDLRLPFAGLPRQARRSLRQEVLAGTGGDPTTLSMNERQRALSYARAYALHQPISLAQSGFIFLGLLGVWGSISTEWHGWSGWLGLISLTLVGGSFIVSTILTVPRVKRASTYARQEAWISEPPAVDSIPDIGEGTAD
jgi:hypothetical protein